MDLTPDNPVTLVVKAPNQRIADQTIECMLGWTVKKLKEHLSAVYPSKPQETEQKLIYSGKLLQDHLTLKDILRQYGEETQHTVHLVCAPTSEGFNSTTETFPADPMVNNLSVGAAPPPQGFTTEGLRYRGSEANPMYTQAPSTMAHGYDNPSAMWNQYMQQAMAQNPAMAYMAYNPQQYMWMQQMYSQYMAQYMQYYQTVPEAEHPVTNPADTPAAPQPNVNAPVNQPANQGNPRPPANQNIRMNAQGGPVDDDDEDEFGQRDWLDWVYSMCRFGVLLSIVYFYSTMSRFVIVFLFFFVVYLYEKGWFGLGRRAQPAVPAEQDAPAVPAPTPDLQNNAEQNNEQVEDANNSNTEESESTDAQTDGASAVLAEEPRPGVLAVLWCFISTFFTSLVPQPPPAVNAN